MGESYLGGEYGISPDLRQPNKEEEKIHEGLIACLQKHIVDIKPQWHGNRDVRGHVGGSVIGAVDVKVERCDPPVNVPKLSIEGGKSVAFIGPNGSGKSTVFDAFMERGNANFRSGDMGRGGFGYGKGVHGKETLRIARLDQEELLGDIDNLSVDEVLGQVVEHFKKDFPVDWTQTDDDAFDRNLVNQEAEQRIEELVGKVGKLFEVDDFKHRKVSELSGGERTKLSLLMLLGSEPDVMLLDEPTNHLDLESIAKLTGLFEMYKRAGVGIVNVSHVEWFLQEAGQDGTLEIEMGRNSRELVASNSSYNKYKKKEKRSSAIIKGGIQWDQYYDPTKKSGALFTADESITIPDSPLQEVQMPDINRGDTVVFSGKNGTGKTKFLEAIIDKSEKQIRKEKGVQVAYMPQFWPDDVAEGNLGDFFSWVKQETSPNSDATINQFKRELKRVGFSKDERGILEKPVASFSGGEQRLLWFLTASLFEGTDAIFLDEPTNHMDEATVQEVVKAIQDFPGTVVLSTHDLRLMEALEGKGHVVNIEFEKVDGQTMIEKSDKSPLAYAKDVIKDARKQAKRIKRN